MKVLIRLLCLLLLVSTSIFVGFSVGRDTTFLIPSYPSQLTASEALVILRGAEAIHQVYVDHPEYCSKEAGDVAWHQRWVEYYRQLQGFILKE